MISSKNSPVVKLLNSYKRVCLCAVTIKEITAVALVVVVV